MSVTPGAHGFDHADRVGTEAIRQRQRVAAGAEVDVDEVDRDAGVAHARLTGTGLADLDRLRGASTSGPPVRSNRMAWT